MKYFYSHLISIEELVVELDQLTIKDEHKKHLSTLVDSTIHHTVLDIVMTSLSEQDRITFLKQYQQDPENKNIMEFLEGKITDVEDKISKMVKELLGEFKKDIKEAKQNL